MGLSELINKLAACCLLLLLLLLLQWAVQCGPVGAGNGSVLALPGAIQDVPVRAGLGVCMAQGRHGWYAGQACMPALCGASVPPAGPGPLP